MSIAQLASLDSAAPCTGSYVLQLQAVHKDLRFSLSTIPLLLSELISIPYEFALVASLSVRACNSLFLRDIRSMSSAKRRLLDSLPPMDTKMHTHEAYLHNFLKINVKQQREQRLPLAYAYRRRKAFSHLIVEEHRASRTGVQQLNGQMMSSSMLNFRTKYHSPLCQSLSKAFLKSIKL